MKIEDKKRVLNEMVLHRRFEERCYQAYIERKIGGFLHLYPGQEACCNGVMEAARPGHDYVITGYRDHVHAIKCGADPKQVMAELYGKETGSSKGRGGSMHIFDAAHRFMGGYALVGGPFPLAAGIAKAIQLKGGDEIAICFLGDAANNQGTFHETMNMTALWKLPVLFVCENNHYGIGTALDRSTAVVEQSRRVCSYDMESARCDGQDFDTVYENAQKAVDYVRKRKGPFFLELITYRYRGHSMSDARGYRSREEEEMWKQRDPIFILRDKLVAAQALTAAEFEQMEKDTDAYLENEVIPFCVSSPDPRVEDLTKYVFAERETQLRWLTGTI